MTLENLQSAMIAAMKSGDKFRKSVISDLIGQIKLAAINKNCRDNITETLVDETLLKSKKMVQESIDLCPTSRTDLLDNYNAQMKVICEFAPTLMTDEEEIKLSILDVINNEMELTKANRGKIMKIIAPVLKGKADMSVVNKVLGGMLE